MATALAVATALSDPASAATTTPTFRQAANHACAVRTATEHRLEPQEGAGDVLRFFRGIASAQRTLVAGHAALRPPRADRRPFRRLVAAERAVIPLLDRAVLLLEQGDSYGEVVSLVGPDLGRASARISARAKRVRLRACESA